MSGLVVIGGSYAGIQAALTAREAGYTKPVTVVTDEHWLPYEKPPLSKDFLLNKMAEQNLILRDKAFFDISGIELVLGNQATEIDRRDRRVALDGDSTLQFDELVIATGSRARRLAVADAEVEGICYLRSLTDAVDLKARLKRTAEIVIVGGGFIGLEVAASAAKLGKKVTVVESGSRLLERAISPLVSSYLRDVHQQHGVEIRFGDIVASIESQHGRVTAIVLASGTKLRADLVLVGIGGIANDELARRAGLNCANGVVVDAHGRSEATNIFAAGDCANHYNRFAEGWIRLESVHNAQDQARAAGLAIAGQYEPYESVPRFWSDQYDVKLQMVGLCGRFDQMAVRGPVEGGRFSVFYFRQSKLIAVESVNRPGDQMAARRLIANGMSPSLEQATDESFDLKVLLKAAEKART
ncbi:FAD-dependent oxidoreductase [Bradyrhizobium sp. Tv2a-2]|uniref:NAD(P)/FAD-dependent oxidoreductase n=1 Tax=Bradyrhizobium sp. Tv2a-2 TaxID=113395 RepID=UPI000419D731|nr:FAD-dependent oxidoreductase [Bradyrhizobium sp. Tv2a-2]